MTPLSYPTHSSRTKYDSASLSETPGAGIVPNLENSAHESLLPSITSTELRKLVFSLSSIWNVFPEEDTLWASIDNHLCELVARLGRTGHNHVLEVELRPAQYVDGLDLTLFFPKFMELGVVNITDPVHDDWSLFSLTVS